MFLTLNFYLLKRNYNSQSSSKQVRRLWESLSGLLGSGLLGWLGGSLWGGLLGNLPDGLLGWGSLWGGLLWGGSLGWSGGGYMIKVGKLIWFVQRIIKLICKFDEFKLAPRITLRMEKFLRTTAQELISISTSSRGHMAGRCHPTHHVYGQAPGLGCPGRVLAEGSREIGGSKVALTFWHCVWCFLFLKK